MCMLHTVQFLKLNSCVYCTIDRYFTLEIDSIKEFDSTATDANTFF